MGTLGLQFTLHSLRFMVAVEHGAHAAREEWEHATHVTYVLFAARAVNCERRTENGELRTIIS